MAEADAECRHLPGDEVADQVGEVGHPRVVGDLVDAGGAPAEDDAVDGGLGGVLVQQVLDRGNPVVGDVVNAALRQVVDDFGDEIAHLVVHLVFEHEQHRSAIGGHGKKHQWQPVDNRP